MTQGNKHSMIAMRTGIGFDMHRYAVGSGITVGGIFIPCDKKIIAHSDGDVLLHALCDAFLGAGALGDIGTHFPNTMENQHRSSRDFLRHVMQLLAEQGFHPLNLDAVIIAEKPMFSPLIGEMRQCIAEDAGLDLRDVSVKATSTDRLGVIGREEGIAALATVTVNEE